MRPKEVKQKILHLNLIGLVICAGVSAAAATPASCVVPVVQVVGISALDHGTDRDYRGSMWKLV